jgi:GH15 family glucan-1,4-alpha-glucosidase
VTTENLIKECIEIILRHQAGTGAYLASPAFAHYRYAWLRDGAFTAYAMNRASHHESARRFYQWCDGVIQKHAQKARAAIALVHAGAVGGTEGSHHFLHTRYTVEGEEVTGEWGSFQLDGYGTWLWGLPEHVRLSGERELIEKFSPSIELTLDYLATCWSLPNFDCWEEWGDRVHPSTLAAIYAGIKAMEEHMPNRAEELSSLRTKIQQFVRKEGTANGQFIKSIGNPVVDASLLWIAVPFGLVVEDDPIMVRTVETIERELLIGCGVHRYSSDTYYGGGQWLLLSAWLGWYYGRTGKTKQALEIMKWIESKMGHEGLPEQVQEHLLSPGHYDTWLERAGRPASPLLWSHAMYLILASELDLLK